MKVLQALLRGLPAATLLVLQTVTAAPTRAPTSAPTTAAPKNWACVRLDGVSLLYFPVTIDSNGDVAALSKTGFGVSLDNCKKTDVSKTPIYISCGCDYKDKSLGITTGYDLGPSHWCNTGKTALNAQPPNPDCILPTPQPTPQTTIKLTPAPTPEPTPQATPQQTPAPTPETTPNATPQATPATTSASNPQTTPCETPANTPDETPAPTPASTPEATPASTPDATPAATPASTPDATPAATPASTPEATPASTPASTPWSYPWINSSIHAIGYASVDPTSDACCCPSIHAFVDSFVHPWSHSWSNAPFHGPLLISTKYYSTGHYDIWTIHNYSSTNHHHPITNYNAETTNNNSITYQYIQADNYHS
ncbi:unnamed protein product [Aphanomyces euteiches]